MGEIQRIEGEIGSTEESFTVDRRELSKRIDEDRRNFQYQLDERRQQIIRDFKEGKAGKHGQFSSKFKDFANAMALLSDLSSKFIDRERTRYALKAIRSGTYKKWDK